tara:strand:+ start:3131 stop:3361 length:231 start_codon:yes stop_codon:yes gene_type:complete
VTNYDIDEIERQANSPEHYSQEIEPIDYILANELGFCEGNIIKYVTRYPNKGGIQDLMKAKKYIDILIDQEIKSND